MAYLPRRIDRNRGRHNGQALHGMRFCEKRKREGEHLDRPVKIGEKIAALDKRAASVILYAQLTSMGDFVCC